MPVLLSVWGAAPGIGKSSLCVGLRDWLTSTGRSTEHFREDEVFSRDEFAAVAAEFTSTERVQLGTLVAATRR